MIAIICWLLLQKAPIIRRLSPLALPRVTMNKKIHNLQLSLYLKHSGSATDRSASLLFELVYSDVALAIGPTQLRKRITVTTDKPNYLMKQVQSSASGANFSKKKKTWKFPSYKKSVDNENLHPTTTWGESQRETHALHAA